jgi:RHS repeat-associated protein
MADGWSLSNHHAVSSSGKVYLGSGGVMDVHSQSQVLRTGVTNSLRVGDDGYYQKGGNVLDYQIEEGGVILDNVTGLRWEQVTEVPLRVKTLAEATQYCEGLSLGGHEDWRLPTSKEVGYTVYKGSNIIRELVYQQESTSNWNQDKANPSNLEIPVICVQGDRLNIKYVEGLSRNNSSDVVVDSSNGLMWQDDASVLTTQLSYADAIDYCENMDRAGYTDWRMPNANELIYALPNSVFANRFYYPYDQNGGYYMAASPDAKPFWSSTQNSRTAGYAWAVESEGYPYHYFSQLSLRHVRCVRDDPRISRSPYVFDNAGKHIATIDLDSGQQLLTFNYGAFESGERLISVVDRFGNTLTINRQQDGRPTSIVTTDGVKTYLNVDVNHDLVGVSYEDGSNRQFFYSDGLMTNKFDQNGNSFATNYDFTGRVIGVSDPEGGLWRFFRDLDLSSGDVSFGYSTAEGNRFTSLISLISENELSKSSVTENGTPIEFITNLDTKQTTDTTCGVLTQVEYVTDPKTLKELPGKITVRQPGGLARVSQISKTYGQGSADFGRLTTQAILNGQITIVEEDFTLNTARITSPMGRLTAMNYSPMRLLESVAIPGLNTVQYQYDTRGRLTAETIGSRTTWYSYDNRGNLATITAPDGKVTAYKYDLLGRVISTTYPDGSSTTFSYDDKGNMTRLVVPTHNGHGFTVNGVDNPVTETAPSGKATRYGYDRDRNLVSITLPSGDSINNDWRDGKLQSTSSPEGAVYYTYNCGSKVSQISKGSDRLNYLWDGDLLLKETSVGIANNQIGFSYNNDFRLTGLSYGGATTTLGYDADGLLSAINGYSLGYSAFNTLLESKSDGTHNASYQHNGYGEVTQASAGVAGHAGYSYQLSYNNSGKISDKIETLNGVSTTDHYTYDAKGRLIEVSRNSSVIESYGYDANGNRLSAGNTLLGIVQESAQFNLDDQLIAKGDSQYQYDANGRLSQKVSPQGTTTYRYSSTGQLLQVRKGADLIEYQHNPTGQRIAKKVNGQLVEKYQWLNLTTLLAIHDANDNVVQRFEYSGERTPTRMTQGGQRYYILSDYQGTPKLVTDASGNVVKTISYDSFGNVIEDSNPGFRLPFGFAGGLYDQDTGLVRFGYRDYDADAGRWTAKDPISFKGGDTNLYGYVTDDPINWIDPDGLIRLLPRGMPMPRNMPPAPRAGEGMARYMQRHNQWREAQKQNLGEEIRQPSNPPPAPGEHPIGSGGKLLDKIRDFFDALSNGGDFFGSGGSVPCPGSNENKELEECYAAGLCI